MKMVSGLALAFWLGVYVFWFGLLIVGIVHPPAAEWWKGGKRRLLTRLDRIFGVKR